MNEYERVIQAGAVATIVDSHESDGVNDVVVRVANGHGSVLLLMLLSGTGVVCTQRIIADELAHQRERILSRGIHAGNASVRIIDLAEFRRRFPSKPCTVREGIEAHRHRLYEYADLRRERGGSDWRGEMPLTVDPAVKELLAENPYLTGIIVRGVYAKRGGAGYSVRLGFGKAVKFWEEHSSSCSGLPVSVSVELVDDEPHPSWILSPAQANVLRWYLAVTDECCS
ncbi:hypothetical protein H6758_03125 [Candidatus Nomurabacteria bacterium]|nr:hypothetical protein [Candidatus Nomurabacteria bacterium]